MVVVALELSAMGTPKAVLFAHPRPKREFAVGMGETESHWGRPGVVGGHDTLSPPCPQLGPPPDHETDFKTGFPNTYRLPLQGVACSSPPHPLHSPKAQTPPRGKNHLGALRVGP